MMSGAYRPGAQPAIDVSPYVLLAGDTHCHVSPPDNPGHVSRDLPSTVALAEAEGIDFLLLSPHLWDEFYAEPGRREEALSAARELRRRIDETDTDVMLFPGFEYSTHSGHATLGFADLDRVLAEIPLEEADADRFFDGWVAHGGVILVNHPLLTPLDDVAVRNAQWDLSWRPWTTTSRARSDVEAIHRLAHGWEAENSAVTHLRDWYLLGRPDNSRRSVLFQLDRRIPREGRRMTPVGGSDSHSHHLIPVTFVLAAERSERGVRDALVAGRVCIRDPRACTLEARPAGGDWQRIGASMIAEGAIEVRAPGGPATVVLNGAVVGRAGTGEVLRLEVPAGRCSVLRASVGSGDSAPIYVNCPFAG